MGLSLWIRVPVLQVRYTWLSKSLGASTLIGLTYEVKLAKLTWTHPDCICAVHSTMCYKSPQWPWTVSSHVQPVSLTRTVAQLTLTPLPPPSITLHYCNFYSPDTFILHFAISISAVTLHNPGQTFCTTATIYSPSLSCIVSFFCYTIGAK